MPHIATRLIATAFWGGKLKTMIKVGTKMKPPPRPHMDAGKPTINPNSKSVMKREMPIKIMLRPRLKL